MNAKLYISSEGISLDFESETDRDTFFANMADNRSMGFAPQDAAKKIGDRYIQLDHAKFKIAYTWPVAFR